MPILDFLFPTRTTVNDLHNAWAVEDATKTLTRIAENPREDPTVRIEAIRKLAEIAKGKGGEDEQRPRQ